MIKEEDSFIDDKSEIKEFSQTAYIEPIVDEPLVLNSPSSVKNPVLITKQEKIRNYVLFSFLFLAVIIIILLALRKL